MRLKLRAIRFVFTFKLCAQKAKPSMIRLSTAPENATNKEQKTPPTPWQHSPKVRALLHERSLIRQIPSPRDHTEKGGLFLDLSIQIYS